jgi:hypothetical protein
MRLRLVVAGGLIVVSVAVVVGVLVSRHPRAPLPSAGVASSSQPSSPAPPLVGSAPSGSPDPVAVVAASMLAGLPARAAVGDVSMFAPSAGVDAATVRALLPAGSSIVADPGSWRRTGDVASINVTVTKPGAAPVAEVAVLFDETDGWRVALTMPAAASSPALPSVGAS